MGSGAFGRVVKADAVGLKENESVTTVAVKMIRPQLSVTSNNGAIESLISELKILGYLGSHLNVVNLLGACTKRISRGELFVIVEYCRFGNVCTFLRQQRSNFVNLVDPTTGALMQSDCNNPAVFTPIEQPANDKYVDMFK